MITKEQLIEKFGIKAGLEQVDFDRKMQQLRMYETEIKKDNNKEIALVEKMLNDIRQQRAELLTELHKHIGKIIELQNNNRLIGGAFYECKKELIRLNPLGA